MLALGSFSPFYDSEESSKFLKIVTTLSQSTD